MASEYEEQRGMMSTGETDELGKKPYSIANFSTTNPIQTEPGAKPVVRCEMPATYLVIHGTAFQRFVLKHNIFHVHLAACVCVNCICNKII
jgi:hypothetical protein